MIIQSFDSLTSYRLVAELSAVHPTAQWLDDTDRTVVAIDGAWWPATWRQTLHDLLNAGHPLAVVEARTNPAEPVPASRGWARLARNLVTAASWQHPDWRSAPWVAVRTSPRSMLIVAGTGLRPDMLDSGLDRWRPFGPHEVQTRARKAVVPMTVLDARHDFPGTGVARLTVLVDRIPDLPELRFTAHPVPPDAATGLPQTLYVAVHPRGYVSYLLDDGTGRGCYGEPFDLHLVDGTTRTVVGPWSSRPDVVAAYAPHADVYLGDVAFHIDRNEFRRHPGGGVAAGTLTSRAADRALQVAAANPETPHPAKLADRFRSPASDVQPATDPTRTQRPHRDHQARQAPSPPTPRRRR